MFGGENFREEIVLLISTPIYVLLIGLEIYLSNRKKKNLYTVKDTFTNTYLMLLNMGLDILLRVGVFFILSFFYNYKVVQLENIFMYWGVLFLLEDFMFYWLHRVDHSTRLFWAIHVTHHSSSLFNLTTGFRSSVFQPLYRFIYFIPIVLLGFHPLDILLMYSITQTYGIIVHTQIINKMGVLEHILVTPSHHRVHHASNIPFLDKNLGMILIVWDKLFGTFEKEENCDEPIRYGLTKDQPLKVPFEVVTHEWRTLLNDVKKTTGFKNKIILLFAPPGWSFTDKSQTSKNLQRIYWREKKEAGYEYTENETEIQSTLMSER